MPEPIPILNAVGEEWSIPIFIDKVEVLPGEVDGRKPLYPCIVRFYYFVITLESRLAPMAPLEKFVSFHFKALQDESLFPLSSERLVSVTYRFLVHNSLDDSPFRTANDVQKLFDLLNGEWGMSIDTEYHTCFCSASPFQNAQRGDVYRLNSGTLKEILLNQEDKFISGDVVESSREETFAFQEWNLSVIERVKSRYRENPANTLRGRVVEDEK